MVCLICRLCGVMFCLFLRLMVVSMWLLGL